MSRTSSYRTPREVREAIDGMAGQDWLQRSIDRYERSYGHWCTKTNKSIPQLGPPPFRIMAQERYRVAVDHLMMSGLSRLGYGCYGTVFELSPTDRWVYKLVAVVDNAPYLSYVRWAREQRTGPNRREAWVRCLPRAKVLYEDRWFALVRVERLVSQDTNARALDDPAKVNGWCVLTDDRFRPFNEATTRIKRWSKFTNDMHGGNVMLRLTKAGTYEPVHTDPVC